MAKSFKQNETPKRNRESHQENFDSQTKLCLATNPTILCDIVTHHTKMCLLVFASQNIVNTRRGKRSTESVNTFVLKDDTLTKHKYTLEKFRNGKKFAEFMNKSRTQSIRDKRTMLRFCQHLRQL